MPDLPAAVPDLEQYPHTIRVTTDNARFTASIERMFAPGYSGTGHITPPSAVATLRAPTAPMRAGT